MLVELPGIVKYKISHKMDQHYRLRLLDPVELLVAGFAVEDPFSHYFT
jgi:hypothetical protein